MRKFGNETIFSTSPTSSSTTSPPIHLDSLTIAIMVVPGLITIVSPACLRESEIRSDSLSESGVERNRYAPLGDKEGLVNSQ
ncbi:unnamed protein product [Caenorhabditis nigoni]